MTPRAVDEPHQAPAQAVGIPDDGTLPADFVLEQPPAKFAHLQGEALRQALIKDTEEWNRWRAAAECGRTVGTFVGWVKSRSVLNAAIANGADRKRLKLSGRIAPMWKAKHGPSGEVWPAGVLRRWFMQEGLMTREGVLIPHKPTGYRQNAATGVVRTSEVREMGPQLLAEFNRLRAEGVAQADAYEQVASEHGLSPTQLKKRLEAGRPIVKGTAAEFLRAHQQHLADGAIPVESIAALARDHQVSKVDAWNRVRTGIRMAKLKPREAAGLLPKIPEVPMRT